MKKDYKEMKYFKEYQYKSNIKETNKDFFNEIISFFVKNINNAFIKYDDIPKLSKEEIISSLDLFYYMEKKIPDIRNRTLESIDLKSNEKNFFKIVVNFDIDFKIYFAFKISNNSNVIFLNPEEIKTIAKKKRNSLLVNISFSDDQPYNIELLNITDCYSLKKIKTEQLKKVDNYDFFKEKEVIYIREIYYNKLKKDKLITK